MDYVIVWVKTRHQGGALAGRQGSTRTRMLDGAVELLRERGTAGVNLDAVLARTGTPRGSVYHHFPGGRNELVVAATRHAGDQITRAIDKVVATGDALALLDMFVRFWRRSLRDTGYQAGCPVLAVAVDGRADLPEAAGAVREIFDAWHERFTLLLRRQGAAAPRAQRLASITIAAIEGAIVLCRVRGDTIPLDDVAAELRDLLGAAGGG
jgi:AcrR family transcriptional regulator